MEKDMEQSPPKKGSIERIVLDKLIERGDKGITIFDLPESLNIDDAELARIIQRLENGIYESEIDSELFRDA
jgi:hypothetical protein